MREASRDAVQYTRPFFDLHLYPDALYTAHLETCVYITYTSLRSICVPPYTQRSISEVYMRNEFVRRLVVALPPPISPTENVLSVSSWYTRGCATCVALLLSSCPDALLLFLSASRDYYTLTCKRVSVRVPYYIRCFPRIYEREIFDFIFGGLDAVLLRRHTQARRRSKSLALELKFQWSIILYSTLYRSYNGIRFEIIR